MSKTIALQQRLFLPRRMKLSSQESRVEMPRHFPSSSDAMLGSCVAWGVEFCKTMVKLMILSKRYFYTSIGRAPCLTLPKGRLARGYSRSRIHKLSSAEGG